jgi:hypothetical protein
MKKLDLLFGVGWAIAGLLALKMVLAVRPVAQPPAVVDAIRESCQLPAGTVVFVVREPAEEAR